MTKMNYTRVRQENQARKHGRDYGDDVPAFGSWADQQRVDKKSSNDPPYVELNRVRGAIPRVQYRTPGARSTVLTKCHVCGQMIRRMRRHLSRAHGILPEGALPSQGVLAKDNDQNMEISQPTDE